MRKVSFKMIVEIDGVQHCIGETDFSESVQNGIEGGARDESSESICEWVAEEIDYNFSPM